MPELPEVEAARRAVEEHCVGKKITKAVIANDSKVIDGVSPSDFEASLLGKTIVSAHRKGKNMWLQLDSPPFPSFQFGMAGAVYIKGVAVTKYKRSAVKDTDEWPSKYSKLFIELDDGLELSFTDKRRFAKVRLLEDPASVPPISELGPDALLEPMTIDEFIKSLSKKKIAIKALLLDQARIHPLQVASSLTRESCETLHQCIKQVIEKAMEVGADSSQFPSNWIFHSREKKPGKAFVDGKKIDFISAGGRTTAYVPELQKLSGTQAAKASVKPRKQTPMRKKEENDEDDDDDDALDEPASEEEKNTKRAKSKKGQNPKGGGKKPPAKRKVEESDNDSDDNDDNNDDDDDDEDKDGDQKKAKRVTKNKQTKVEKTTKKKVEKSHKGKPMKKKVK
ncbi:formamidopyrimidine-DNA glycosylase isoform X3 [Vitis vinifera]|uniref:formamidopyrimidine-DNA glycosylase isoform X3 n=1 Tax=Vitis vinifera TaxID=29760 RepID=UPI0008FF7EF3|nr:formamidopyrimidine-DNA glycosylase isoform X3 [Vitis vinifera]|eukprot:XP_019077947.1 PREDICTED: formamidopyrimidine-DNA glycosylase isoform X3 [Vitis vinifera]